MILTPGRLLFENIVPAHLRGEDDGSPIDAGRVKSILQEVAEKEPSSYRDISHKLLTLGARASTEVSSSFGLEDLKSPVDKASIVAGVRKQEALINARKDLTPQQKINERVKIYGKLSSDLPEQVFTGAMGRGSNLARMVASGARGSKGQLNSNIGADFLMLDANSNPIPVPITHSYAEGLSPGEYFASAYGTRRGLLSTKLCCARGTKVLMADFSEREIQDIRPGEWVIGATKSGETLRVQVKNVFDNGARDCWKYVFRRLSSRTDTVEVCVTPDHQLLARRRDWGVDKHLAIDVPTKTAAGKMSKTRHVLVPAEGGEFDGISEPRALLLGLLMGDGCLTSQKHLLLSCADQTLLDDTREYFAGLNFEASRGASQTSYTYILKYLEWPKKAPGGGCGCPTKAWLKEIGVMGKYAHEKEIPSLVWGWDNASIAQLIAGIYSSDGSIYQTTAGGKGRGVGIGIALCLTSRQMLEQAKRLLEKRFGIYGSTIYFVPKENKEHAKRDQWHFNINHRKAVDLFAQHICLVGKKNSTLKALRESKAPSRCNEQYTFKFLHREHLGELPTYDIEVDHPDHLFVLANGVISSNSVAESGYLSKQLAAAGHDLVVSTHNCETDRGIPVSSDDKDSIGSVMARAAAGYPAGTIVTGRVLRQMRDNKVSSLIVRSPLTCQAPNGICAVCAGIREKNRFPRIMENLGLAASSSVGEPLSQGTLCLADGTEVRMADWSIKKIEDIVVGDWALGADKTGRTFPVQVLNVFNNGKKEVVRTVFKTGVKTSIHLDSTDDHKILCKWNKTGCAGSALNHLLQVLPVGTKCRDFSAIQAEAFDDSGTGLSTDPWALFLGMVLGDGCCVESVGAVHLSCADDLMIQDTEMYLRSLNLRLKKLTGHDCYWRFSQIVEAETEQDKVSGQFCGSFRNPAQIAVRRFGIYGKFAHEKEIPQEAWSWDNRSVADLIAGLFATGGSIYLRKQRGETSVGLSFTSVSKEMVLQVKDLLQWRFGIYSTFHVTPPSLKKKRGAFDIKIATTDSCSKFFRVIPMIGDKRLRIKRWEPLLKKKRMLKWKRASRQSVVPLGLQNTKDIEVDHPDHLFVLVNGMVVANSEKHSGGVASSSGKAVSAFRSIDSLVQIPDVFPNAATIARNDGVVKRIEDAPQGGSYIHVDDEQHYVPHGRDILVKKGDRMEAGDVLSAGVPNPAEIVRHKGIGEGRLYFVGAMRKAMLDNKLPVDRRNLEILGRSLVNHVRITNPDGFGGFLPDDVVEYDAIEHGLGAPDKPGTPLAPSKALGKFLSKPALHYSIGTRVTPSVVKTLSDNGESSIDTTDDSPGFEPEMQRVADIPGFKQDWMAQFAGSRLKNRLQRSVHSGDAVSNIHGISYIPGLAKGTEFGKPPPGVVGY